MDNIIPTSPTQWMDLEMPYYQQTDFGIENPYEGFSDSTIITTSTQDTSRQCAVSISSDHQHSSLSPDQTSLQIGGNVDQLSPKTSTGKSVRRRSRASKKTPTTLLNASITNFRALVQQHTGCHTSPKFKNQKGPINLSFGPPTDDHYQNEFLGSNSIGNGYYCHDQQADQKSKDKQQKNGSSSASYSNSVNSKLSVDDYGW